jgi:hypothetical protein
MGNGEGEQQQQEGQQEGAQGQQQAEMEVGEGRQEGQQGAAEGQNAGVGVGEGQVLGDNGVELIDDESDVEEAQPGFGSACNIGLRVGAASNIAGNAHWGDDYQEDPEGFVGQVARSNVHPSRQAQGKAGPGRPSGSMC